MKFLNLSKQNPEIISPNTFSIEKKNAILQACVTDDRLVDMQTKRHCQDSNEKLQFRISIANVLLRTSKNYMVLIPGAAIV